MIKDLFSGFLQDFLSYFSVGFMIFIIVLAFVYIVGRMLGIVKSYQIKNIIALLLVVPLSYLYVEIFQTELLSFEKYWYISLYTSVACILFVLLGWKLFDRVDTFLDTKFAPDKETPKPKERKKRKK